MNARRLIPVTLLVAVVLALSVPAHANHPWNGYHWKKTSSSVPITIVDSVTSTWDGHLDTAIADWDQSSVLTLSEEAGDTSSRARKQCRPIAGKIRVCNQTYGFNGWLGIATIWLSGGHISQGTTKLNDSYFNTSTYNSPAWRQFVACQEPGHNFGLDHQDENFNNGNLGSCMDYTNDPDGPPSNEHPNAHDYDQLASIYNHTESSATAGSGPGKGNQRVIRFVLWAN